ncbi:MAG TPA: ChaN family lipoprotein [Burkholderiales bacterium]|nr:ChaN family lipoprotein [Burkholderiales bacterium]
MNLKALPAVLLASALGIASHAAEAATPKPACLAPAKWYALDAAKPRAIDEAKIVAEMAQRDVVLLGEHHDENDHHQWQLHTLAALHAVRPDMVIGFEAFPRRVQPVLDRWVAGELDPARFLREVEWEKVWNLPPDLYMPLFQFARIKRIPMVALNVEKSLTEAIAAKGWDAIDSKQREGVSRAAPPVAEYEEHLFNVFKEHGAARSGKGTLDKSDRRFRNFVEAQGTWDRAMAEALAARVKREGNTRPLAVGIMGAGHVRGGYGVAHQLRDLGVTRVGTLLPLDATAECADIKTAMADAGFVLPAVPRSALPPPRLGVRLELKDKSVTIANIEKGSLAEKSGLNAGDVVLMVAGTPAVSIADVVGAVRSSPPGTWLPLQVRRGTSTLDLVVKFPPRA